MSAPRRALLIFGLAAGCGCLLLVLVIPDWMRGTNWETFSIGLVIGTIFGQTTLAAMWSALGPLTLQWRMPLSLVWLAALVAATTLNLALEQGLPPRLPHHQLPFLVILAGCLVGQWIVVQVPLWCLVLGYGWHLRASDQAGEAADLRQRQFGIGQLMVITAIVGVLLGVGRAAVLQLTPRLAITSPDFVVSVFLAVTTIVLMLPLIAATWLPRGAFLATAVVAVLIALVTEWEAPLLQRFDRNVGGGPDLTELFGWINAVMGVWICLVILALRLSGYGVGQPPTTGPAGRKPAGEG